MSQLLNRLEKFGNDLGIKPVDLMPTGFVGLDCLLNGGFRWGQAYEISGEVSTGKTSLIYSLLGAVQKVGHAVAFCDLERAYDGHYASNSLSIGELLVFNDLSKNTLSIIDRWLSDSTNEKLVVAIDSLGAIPTAERADEMFKAFLPKLQNRQIILLCTNQVRDNFIKYGQVRSYLNKKCDELFAARIRLSGKHRGHKRYQITYAEAIMSKYPTVASKTVLAYDTLSFDRIVSLVCDSVALNVIEKIPNHYLYEELNFNTFDDVINYFSSHAGRADVLINKVVLAYNRGETYGRVGEVEGTCSDESDLWRGDGDNGDDGLIG